jgi:hypothetical protein
LNKLPKIHGSWRRVTLSLASLLALSSPQFSLACDGPHHGPDAAGIVPANNLWFGAEDKSYGGLLEAEFHSVIDQIEKLYIPEVAAHNAELKIIRDWNDGTVNAYAMREKDSIDAKIWQVKMFGGFARHPQLSVDAFALVLCHELGHHLGGAPKKLNHLGQKRWASAEGQADYWGAMKCFKKYASLVNNKELIAEQNSRFYTNRTTHVSCAEQFSDEEEQAICVRTAMAGKSLSNVFADLEKAKSPTYFNNPDNTVVNFTFLQHPWSQCRLDTFFQAALCTKNVNDTISDTDHKKGFCNEVENHWVGQRPACWFSINPDPPPKNNGWGYLI